MGIEAKIQGRPKHLYSIFRKMRGKNLAFEQLYDIRAVRVIVKNVRECYAVLGVVHDLWTPVEGEFDDYIASPKANDYKSLHTAVVGPEGRTLEVQIRTDEMHQHSEHGVAAHWRYKEGRRADQKFDAKIAWLRQVLAWKADVLAGEGAGRVPRGVFEETIYVLTPQGRVVDLPAGATPIDFAYHVHTDLGHRCRGAKVDGQMVPLNTKLANAQRVEIISAKQGGPSRDWLSGGYLASPRALAKVRQWFRHEDFDSDAASGRTALEKELTRLGATSFAHERIATACGFPRTEDFFAALGRGEVTSRQIETAVRGEAPAAAPPPAVTVVPAPASRASSGVLVLGVNNIATLVAKCCKPVPPDPIIGFITRTRGVMVHRADCPNITGLAADQRERLLPADWGKTGEAPFSADIEVVALDRQGLLRDISEAISRERINVTAVNTLSRGAHAYMRFTLQVDSARRDPARAPAGEGRARRGPRPAPLAVDAARLVLKPGREKSLRHRHPWIFSGAIERVEGSPQPGDAVAVTGPDGEPLAWAAWSPSSQIRARVWSFDAVRPDRRGVPRGAAGGGRRAPRAPPRRAPRRLPPRPFGVRRPPGPRGRPVRGHGGRAAPVGGRRALARFLARRDRQGRGVARRLRAIRRGGAHARGARAARRGRSLGDPGEPGAHARGGPRLRGGHRPRPEDGLLPRPARQPRAGGHARRRAATC